MTTSAITPIAITPEMIREHGLTPEEFEKIKQLLGGREPTRTELGIFSVMWSEHCSYKSSRIHLKKLPTRGQLVVQGPGENAGIIDIGHQSLASVVRIGYLTLDQIYHTLRSARYATEIQFEDLRVPSANVLGEVNGGFRIARDRVARQRIPYSAGCIGVATVAQEMAVEYAKQRSTFGAPLSTRQAVQWMLVDNEIDLRQARWVTLDAAWKADHSDNFIAAAAMAKVVATEAAGRVVDRAMQIHGGMGVAKELPLERWYRELRIRRIGEGPNEIQRMIIARDLLRGPRS